MKKILLLLICIMSAGILQTYAQCNAQFTSAVSPSGNNLLNVNFTNTSTFGSNSLILSNSIDYGDGNYAMFYSANTLSHNYASPGTYNVKVAIYTLDSSNTSGGYCSDSITHTVTVAYQPCGTTITTQNNGGGNFTFYATNPANTTGMSYSWNFGDGSTPLTGNQVSHTYTTGGNFTVTLTSTGGGCTSTNSTTIYSGVTTFNCNNATTDFTYTVNNSAVNFNNTSSGTQNLSNIESVGSWDFGDGTSSNYMSFHNYTAAGTYTVTLVNQWIDSINNQVICSKTVSHNVTISNLNPVVSNQISGALAADSMSSNQYPNSFKVWLISYDSAANTLIAVDSQIAVYSYTFQNVNPGTYLVKADAQNQTVGQQGWLPTYHYSSLYWNSANMIPYQNGISSGNSIFVQAGTVLAGPGFIGGNISAGAGKGTGTGVEGLLVFLRDNTNKVVGSAYTDANGDFSFTNLPLGVYNVYPEAMNYATTPFAAITIDNGHTSVTHIDFEQNSDEIKPLGVTGITAVKNNENLRVFPNPAHETLSVDNVNGQYQSLTITNTLGQIIKSASIQKGMNTISINTLSAGTYFLTIKGKENSGWFKVVKQ